ncbi:hypothetical protein V7O66_10345 [Methanolobus sp. ZRKC3]|uniref:hypothetical protein n=1 Tax=Methanolobus sp. ZRKC3 TaxID=3125786 RepID=UPI0032563A12
MKDDKKLKEDTNGRIHSLDQEQRSLGKRLRAVERRLSMGDVPEGEGTSCDPELEEDIDSIKEDILTLRSEMDELKAKSASTLILNNELQNIEQDILELKQEMGRLEEEKSRLSTLLEQSNSEDRERSSAELRNSIEQLNARLERSEKRDRINIGSVKVPVELSGIVGAAILILTGMLITQSRWDIIRSANFSFGIAFALAAAVLIKFYIANRSEGQ